MQFSLLLAFVQIVGASTILQLNGTTFLSPEFVAGSVRIGQHSKLGNVLPATYLNKLPSSVDDLEKKINELLDGCISTTTWPSSGHDRGRRWTIHTDRRSSWRERQCSDQHPSSLTSLLSKAFQEAAALGTALSVKDIFDLKGIKTGAGSRAYFALYPPANETASSRQRLVDLGAVIIGKLKTAQFAAGEVPTASYADQLAPFNPRGDGYQSPSSSSCGTGAALASYDWLDLGTGTDTTRSLRGPSMANGLFGMRITNASLPLDGILPISAKMDTPSLMARDAKLLRTAYTSWFKAKASYTSFPKRIVLPEEFWPSPNETSMPIFDKFIKDLSTLLDAKVEHVNTSKSFIQHTGNKGGLAAFISDYPFVLIQDQWRAVGAPFIAEYQEQFERFPFINPVPRSGLAIASQVDDKSYEVAVHHLKVYREWYTSQLVPSCEEALVLYPLAPGLEIYRDESLNSSPSPASSYLNTLQAALAGLPDYAVPIGIRKYNSSVGMSEEELPI
ncbi:amidase signature domain-containing protein [Thelonectria olida]|uniref:Amidase signature domain-containing protein n=1 Tax=Thelonectria olida TaxID=1576542 RepID=A0A9P8VRI4_9HYPO|nr:amidase signature domain-containing protein [Thelonectria olida]